MDTKLRLFWAVNLPADLKTRLARLQQKIKLYGAEARWVEEQNLHLTMKFLGETGSSQVKGIVQAAAGALAGCRAFKLELEGIGFFPGVARPRVIWVGARGCADLLAGLASRLDLAMLGLGYQPEERKFSPHLTLARIKSPGEPGRLAGTAASLAPDDLRPGGFMVTSVDLMESRLSGRGPEYRRLAQIELAD